MSIFSLKIIAVLSMTIDHIARVIGQAKLMNFFAIESLPASFWMLNIMEMIGRVAFPLFAFAISEGMRKTHSPAKYILRLTLFALISEPIYYFAFNNTTATLNGFFSNILRFHLKNVLFTLTLGAIAIYIYQRIRFNSKYKILLFALSLSTILLVGELIKCEYGITGILLILLLYLSRTKLQKGITIFIWSIVFYVFMQALSGLSFNWFQVSIFSALDCMFAASSCLAIHFYNGDRGKPIKWMFYIYYPTHLLFLSIIASILPN